MPALPPHTPPVAAAPAPPTRYGFNGAWLGEGLADWRASRPARASAACATSARDPAVLLCRGLDDDLGGGFAAREVTYAFVDGQLARIGFKTSTDGFDYVTAALKKASGLPGEIVRDRLGGGMPHVRMTWRNGRSTIVLSDPLPNVVELSVSFTLDALGSRVAKAG